MDNQLATKLPLADCGLQHQTAPISNQERNAFVGRHIHAETDGGHPDGRYPK
jgi:hypothetical protein